MHNVQQQRRSTARRTTRKQPRTDSPFLFGCRKSEPKMQGRDKITKIQYKNLHRLNQGGIDDNALPTIFGRRRKDSASGVMSFIEISFPLCRIMSTLQRIDAPIKMQQEGSFQSHRRHTPNKKGCKRKLIPRSTRSPASAWRPPTNKQINPRVTQSMG